MSTNTDRVVGKLEELGGSLKRGVGHLIGSERMEANGRAEQLNGRAHQKGLVVREELKQAAELGVQNVEKAMKRAEGSAVQLAGAVQASVGDITANPKLKATGKANERKGRAARKVATVRPALKVTK